MIRTESRVHTVKLPGHHRRKLAAGLLKVRRHPEQIQKRASTSTVRIICISDTHNLCPELPEGDVLIHSGDWSEWGTFDEIQAQLTWLSEQPHQYKIVVAGNHDLLLDLHFLATHPQYKDPQGRTRDTLNFGSVIYLQDESITLSFPGIERSLNIYGSPWTPQYGTSAFQYPRQEDAWSGQVPFSTDILITHGPPANFPNVRPSAGCPYLRAEVARVRPKLMVFGHIHLARGEQTVIFD